MVGFLITMLIVMLIFAALQYQADQRKEAEAEVKALEEAGKKAREDLVRFGASEVVAYGARYGLATGAEMSDDALIRAETQKWTILNGGRQLGKILVKGGTVTVNYDEAGVPTLKLERANFLLTLSDKDYEPFVLSDFHVARPNPETAILTYKAKPENSIGVGATAVWARQHGKWRTVSYQVG
jgi:hypothetical protein